MNLLSDDKPLQTRYSFRYFFGLIPGVLACLGNYFDPRFALANIIWCLVVLVALDWILKPKRNDPPLMHDQFIPDLVLLLSSLLHLLSVITLLYAATPYNSWIAFVGCAVSTGLNSGIAGFITAHELIHRRSALARSLGQINLFFNSYMHFYIEHIHGHHKTVGTINDPATAARGTSFYKHLINTIPGQWMSAFRIEVARLKKGGKEFPYGLSNYVLITSALELIFISSIGIFFGTVAILLFILQNALAIFLLEYVNYIEHYGLTRTPGKKVEAFHSWRSDAPGSRMSLFELVRHSDHHMKASKPFYTLRSYSEAPQLPSGYFGMFYIALFPKWWFRKVDPLIPQSDEKPN